MLRQVALKTLARGVPTRPAVSRVNVVRTVAFQNDSLTQTIKADHDRVRSLFGDYKKANDNEQKKRIIHSVIRELAVHSSKEEMVVYPAVRKFEGDEAADALTGDHKTLKELLSDLDSLTPASDKWDGLVAALEQEFTEHVKEEESTEMPELAAKIGDQQELDKIADKFQKAEAVSPTRPHPLAPDQPPLNQITNPMTAPLDKARDFVRDNIQDRD